MTDFFNYDFEDYGKYTVKTTVFARPPFILEHKNYNIIQPVFTDIEINGGSYAFMPAGDTLDETCSGGSCSIPSYAENCAGLFNTIEKAAGCEFNKMNAFIQKKLGFLYTPVHAISKTVNNFQKTPPISCDFDINNSLPVRLCVVERKFPAFLLFLRMLANGSLVFAFLVFLRSQLVGFLNSKGDE